MGEGISKDGILNRGNLYRLKKCMRRAIAGEDITLGFIGGSITMGSLSTKPENCYAYLVYKWWEEKFNKAHFTYVNAGIGGTTSQFGVARAERDLLSYHPDVVIIEFSVNDENTSFFKETYEGLVRKVFGYECAPAVMLIHNVRYDKRIMAHQIHTEIGRAYDLPSISMKHTIGKEVREGRIKARDITSDDLHPNDKGHAMVASVITNFLEQVYQEIDKEEEIPALREETITKNRYENARRYQNYNSTPILAGFEPDHSKQSRITEFFKKGWTASKEGDSICFSVEATEIAIQYRKTIKKPAPIAKAILDGDESNPIILDSNFKEDWGDCLYIENIAEGLPLKQHTVKITITETRKEDQSEFYLVSLIGSH